VDNFQKKWLNANASRCLEFRVISLFSNYIFRYIILIFSTAFVFILNSKDELLIDGFRLVFMIFSIVHFIFCFFVSINFIQIASQVDCTCRAMDEMDVPSIREFHGSWKLIFASVIDERPGIWYMVSYALSFLLIGYAFFYQPGSMRFIEPVLLVFVGFLIFTVVSFICYQMCKYFVTNYVDPISVAIFEYKSYDEVKTV